MSKLKINKVKVTLKKALESYGVTIYPKLYDKIAKDFIELYEQDLSIDEQDIKLLIVVIQEQRLNYHYRKTVIKTISPNTSDYKQVVKLIPIVNKFFVSFDYGTKKEAYTDFVSKGIQLMGKRYGLNKFSYYADKIFEQANARYELDHTKYYDKVRKMYKMWRAIAATKYGLDLLISETDYNQYANFLWAVESALECGLSLDSSEDYEKWCNAQVDGLAWLGKMPEVYQIHGENAIERYKQYEAPKSSAKPQFKNAQEQELYQKILNRKQAEK